MRQKCANCFNQDINEFHLRLKGGVVDPDEDDDKYVKDVVSSPHIYMLPNAQYDKAGHPKYLLAHDQSYFDLLFALLAKSRASLVEPVWELLQKLPVNEKLHKDIRQLQGIESGWNGLLDSKSTHKLLYSLKIIEDFNKIAADNEAAQKELEQWKRKFVAQGGFQHLLSILTGLRLESIDSKLTLRCIESLLATILTFASID